MGHSSTPKPHWASLLTGETADLQQLAGSLAPPGEPSLERAALNGADRWILRSDRFDEVQDAGAAVKIGLELVDALAGPSVSVLRDPPNVRLEYVTYIKADGSAEIHNYAIAHMVGLGSFTVRAVIQIDANGAIVEPPAPQESELRRYLSLSRRDPRFGKLLGYVAKRGSWPAIYQACDEAESICGGEHKLHGLLGG